MFNEKFLKHYYIMLIPGFLWLLLFNIVPMFGITMAFQDFNPIKGIFASEFKGLDNFKYMFIMRDTKQVFMNTIIISIGKIVGNIIVPLIFALLLNELRFKKLIRPVQTITYLPYFLSWVILGGIVLNVFSYTGPINSLISFFGGEKIIFFSKANLFRPLVIGSDVWKNFGYNAIIYLAALLGIDPTLHEAAAVDGAGRFRRLLRITIPGISSTIILLTVLSLGGILNGGFEQIFNLYNPFVYSTGDIIDTWVYRAGMLNLKYSLATAVGLLKSVISFVLILITYRLSYKLSGYKIF